MMNIARTQVGRSASRLSRAVAAKSELSLQKGVSAGSMSSMPLLSTMSGGLNISQGAMRLAVAKIPLRQMSTKDVIGDPADVAAVEAATIKWRDTVTLNTDDAPKKTAALYAPDSVFWGTVSEECRLKPEHVYDYFDFFARMPKLSMTAYDPDAVRVFGDIALHAGAYTFAWEVDGSMVETRARFTFAYRREKDGWVIVEHHSSKMPEAPAALKAAK